MSVLDGLAGIRSEKRLVAVASTTSRDTFLAKWLVPVAFDSPDPVAD